MRSLRDRLRCPRPNAAVVRATELTRRQNPTTAANDIGTMAGDTALAIIISSSTMTARRPSNMSVEMPGWAGTAAGGRLCLYYTDDHNYFMILIILCYSSIHTRISIKRYRIILSNCNCILVAHFCPEYFFIKNCDKSALHKVK